MTNSIVTVNATQQQPPAPPTIQQTGALISQGGTTKAQNTLTLITQLSDLTSILSAAKAVTSLAQTAGLATITTTSPHGWTNGDVIPVVVAGATPSGYNGLVTATVTGASTLTYSVSSGLSSPATGTITVTLGDESELLNMGTEFFAQGSGLSVYVLELGEGTATEGVATLQTWVTSNPGIIYQYLVPNEWDANSAFITFLSNFNATTSKTYFNVNTTVGTYSGYTSVNKCLLATVPSPTAPATEFTAAAQFWTMLNYNPSSTNKISQLCFSFVLDVTPYPIPGNGTVLANLKAANIGYIDTGAEGGISNTILKWGKTLDGKPFNYWYSFDWAQINLKLSLANAVINGSNSKVNPLQYNQEGINRLQAVAAQVFSNAVTYGLAVGSVVQTQLPIAQFVANFNAGEYAGQLVINAEPFDVYKTENPTDYSNGIYAGFAGVYTFQNGFQQIIFDLEATTFA